MSGQQFSAANRAVSDSCLIPVLCAVILIVIPQLQYKAAPKDENGNSTYFLEVEDYDKYKEYAAKAEASAEKAE